MATFRKSSSKTRLALENSTALPPVPAEVLSHVGEQAAQLTESARRGKSSLPKASRRLGASVAAPAAAPDVIDGEMPDVNPTPPERIETAAEQVVEVYETSMSETHARAVEAAEPWQAQAESVANETTHQALTATAQAVDMAHDLAAPVLDATVEPLEASTTSLEAAAEAVAEHAAERTFSLQPSASVSMQPSQAALNGATEASALLGDFNVKLAELFRDYLVDSIGFFADLTAVRSLPDVVTLNSRHLQRRMAAVSAQSRDLTALAGKLAAQTIAPFKPSAFR